MSNRIFAKAAMYAFAIQTNAKKEITRPRQSSYSSLKCVSNRNAPANAVTEAVFTREEMKQLSLPQLLRGLARLHAEIARLTKNLFVRDRPRNRRYRYGEYQKPQDLRDHQTPGL